MNLSEFDYHPYVEMLGLRLEGFSVKRTTPHYVWNSRCPVCDDSATNKRKKRFYIHMDKDKTTYLVSCRNCNYANSFTWFIKENYNDIYTMMIYELFKKKRVTARPPRPETPIAPIVEVKVDNSAVIRCDKLPDDHPCRKYLAERNIPSIRYERLYYVDDFKEFLIKAKVDTTQFDYIPSDSRVIFVFRNLDGVITHIQGRSLEPNAKVRYMTVSINDTGDKIYGLDHIDLEKKIFVVEGGFDSLFLPNCVATADSNLLSFESGDVYVPDNQYRNASIVKIIDGIISAGKEIVLFPPSFQYKDINDAVKEIGLKSLYEIISENRFKGLSARLRWSQLKKL